MNKLWLNRPAKARPKAMKLSHLLSLITLTAYSAIVIPSAPAAILASDGSRADVQAKINAAIDGDVVTLPAGTFTWPSTVSISGKGIHLRGAGAGRVVARSVTTLAIGTGVKVFTLTAERVPSIEALKSTITTGTTLKIYRTGGEVVSAVTTGNIPWMRGSVTNLAGNTLTMNVTTTNHGGTHPLWIITTEAATTIKLDTGAILSCTEDTTHNVEISGVRFEDSGTAISDNSAQVNINRGAANAQPILVHDCYFQLTNADPCIKIDALRGIVWNCSFVGLPYQGAGHALHPYNYNVDAWLTTSTMGAADTTGKGNLYTEDCDFHAIRGVTDYDSNSRSVMRNCLFNNSGVATHGADSGLFGLRHFEVYDCEFAFNDLSPLGTFAVDSFFLIRGGTGVITNNFIANIYSQDYSDKIEIKLACWNLEFNSGPNPGWGSDIPGVQYPCPRQVGMGRVTGLGVDGKGRTTDSVTYVGDSEPLYIWNNSGSYAVGLSSFGGSSFANSDSVADYIRAGRDYFNDGTPKPGWSKPSGNHPAAYPHSLRGAPRFVQITVVPGETQ